MSTRMERKIVETWKNDDAILWWDGEWWNAERLFALTGKTEEVLRKGGFRPGGRVATLMPNSPALLALSMACWRLGGTVMPLNHSSGIDDLVPVLNHGAPSAVFFGGDHDGKTGVTLKKTGLPGFTIPLDGFPDDIDGLGEEVPSSSDVALMFATSGTTGRPKLVPVTHGNVVSDVEQALRRVRMIGKSDVFLNVLPNFHTLGFIVSGLLPLIFGCRQALMPTFMPPDKVLDCLDSAGVTVVVGVPTMLYFMVAAAAKSGRTFPSTRIVISGGDRFPEKMDRRVEAVFSVPVLEGYGLTECSPVLAVNPDYEDRRPGTVGPILDDVEWQIRDIDGNKLDPQAEGILWVRGPSVASCYFADPENTERRFVDGWFDTGDVASVDESGYVKIHERASDVMIVGGFNVYPQEVENVLLSHPGVREAAVVGRANAMSGQVPYGYVIPAAGSEVSPVELISYCKERLAHYKVPRKIEFVPDFPRNALGKVLRRALREGLDRRES